MNLTTSSQNSNQLLDCIQTLLDAALQYAAQGWHVFPLHHPLPDGACSCGQSDCASIGKHPRTARGLKNATTDDRMIRQWWKKYPQANIAIATGKASNLVVIDVDRKSGGDASLEALEATHGKLTTLSQQTGNGFHFLFTYPTEAEVKNSVSKLAPGVDVRGEGGYIVAAPSLHASGNRYQWRNQESVNPLPAWLLALLQAGPEPAHAISAPPVTNAPPANRKTAYGQAALQREVEKVARAPEHTRNDQLFKSAATLGGLIATGCLEETTVINELSDNARKAGLPMQEIQKTITSGVKAGKKTPREPQGAPLRLVTKETALKPQPQEQPTAPHVAGDYEARNDGLYHWRTIKEALFAQKLTSFRAHILSDVLEDDGEQTKRYYEIEAQQDGRKSRFVVPANGFNSMNWVSEHLGSRSYVFPNQTEHARCAIQRLSIDPVERRIFTHTGWREIDGERCYLHGGGAIGKTDVKAIEVHLPESLKPAVLPVPPTGKAIHDAMASVFDLISLAPDEIIIPALGSVWSSVIGNTDFSIWVYGVTGCGKSQLAALIQSFFGVFSAEKLPGSWLSSANALENIAHAAKDMIFVVDDFKPTGSAHDRARLHKEADRLLRAQGNQAGRQRLTADITQRKTKYPRGLIFNTAEEIPQGESLLARLFVLEVEKTSIDFSQLSGLQRLAADGVFASVMAAFIRWLALHEAEALQGASRKIADWRDYWAHRAIASHRRHATTFAHLTYAWEMWIESAKEAKLLTETEAVRFWKRILIALSMAGSKQDGHRETQNPVTRFIELLQSAIASKAAYLEMKDGTLPPTPSEYGYRKIHDHHEGTGELIGWLNPDDDELLLNPDATFRLLEKYAAHGAGLGVQQTTLWKQLYEAGILKEKTENESRKSYTTLRRIGGTRKPVLVFFAGKTLCATHGTMTAMTAD